jgi:opacity protein-like surface antigen
MLGKPKARKPSRRFFGLGRAEKMTVCRSRPMATRGDSAATTARCCRKRCSTSWNASACSTRCDWAVLGAEAELNYGWMRRTENFGPAPGTDIGQRINWFGSLNAVIGVPVDRALIYGTGGLAFGSVGHSQVMAPDNFSETRTTAGWTLGAGVDFAVTDDIIVGARYRYYDFGRVSYAPGGGFVPRDQRVSLHTIGARVGMKF